MGSGLCVLFVQSKLPRGERRLYDVLVQSDDSRRRGHLHPPSDARAIELLSGHPDSDEFIEEYRWRKTHDIEKAMIITGEVFFRKHHPPVTEEGARWSRS